MSMCWHKWTRWGPVHGTHAGPHQYRACTHCGAVTDRRVKSENYKISVTGANDAYDSAKDNQ